MIHSLFNNNETKGLPKESPGTFQEIFLVRSVGPTICRRSGSDSYDSVLQSVESSKEISSFKSKSPVCQFEKSDILFCWCAPTVTPSTISLNDFRS